MASQIIAVGRVRIACTTELQSKVSSGAQQSRYASLFCLDRAILAVTVQTVVKKQSSKIV
jgi:hypothetical protein